MSDFRDTIKSDGDQINADDLIGQNKVIKITGGVLKPNDANGQKLWFYYEGDDGNKKPYKPNKSMRKVLAASPFGTKIENYVGQSLELYRDPEVKFGHQKVGGVKVSAMTGIDEPYSVMITVRRGKREEHTVKPLTVKQEKPVDPKLYDKAMSEGDALECGLEEYAKWFKSIDQKQFTAEQKAEFAECHVKWKAKAEQYDKDNEEAAV